jgi:hypothetical protein
MMKSWLVYFVFTVTVLTTLATQNQPTAEKNNQGRRIAPRSSLL